MTIKHLVLSGGGAAGFTVYGALKCMHNNEYFSFENIESIHASSAGSIIGGLLILTQNWNDLDNYILKRPWDKLINISPTAILSLWQKKGIFDIEMIKEILKPFLKSNDYNENITLKQLFEKTNIDFYCYTTNVNSDILETVSLSYHTHPDLELCKAICMSSAFPMMFEPICDNSNCFIDGGLLNNFPLNDCININKNTDEILAIKITSNNQIKLIENNTTLPLYLYAIIMKMYVLLNKNIEYPVIKNIINCKIENNSLSRWSLAVSDVSVREEYINIGFESAKKFLEIMDY